MTIKKYSGQDLHVGQWVNLESITRIGFAGTPAKVIDLKPKSILVEAARRLRTGDIDVEQQKTCRLTSVLFVSDTFEEAELMLHASRGFIDSELKIEREAREMAKIRMAEAIATALKE